MRSRGFRPSRKTVRHALIAVIVATSLATGITLVTHRAGDVPDAAPETKNPATFSLDKMRHTATRQGVDEWSVEAETVNLFNAENRAVFNKLSARYFEKSGGVTTMTGDKGVLNTRTRDMEVSGHVIVTRGPMTVTSETLSYTKLSHTIASSTPVVISDGLSTLTGDAMRLDLNAGTLELHGNVTGTLFEESKGRMNETTPR